MDTKPRCDSRVNTSAVSRADLAPTAGDNSPSFSTRTAGRDTRTFPNGDPDWKDPTTAHELREAIVALRDAAAAPVPTMEAMLWALTDLMGVAHRRPGPAGWIIYRWCRELFGRTLRHRTINVREVVSLADRAEALVEARP